MLPCLALAAAMTIPMQLKPGDHTRTLEVGALTREYLLHLPPAYDGARPLPVVLVFHGGGSNPRQMAAFSGLSVKADRAGFIAVYPAGSGRFEKLLTFNGGNCCGHAQAKGIDDVAFVRALLDDLEKTVKVDKQRIFATGMSNGAIMSYLLASELSEKIAAIAPVGGPMGTATCHPKRPVPVLHFHGTDDAFAPYKGGKGAKSVSQTDFYSVEHSIKAWVKANGCPAEGKSVTLPDKTGDGTKVIRTRYGPGRQGSEVVLVTIEGAGHTWPGRTPLLKYLGKSTKNISANDEMWDFFQKHPLK